jgi:hypothetical protein
MKKTERIEQLEKEVKELKEDVLRLRQTALALPTSVVYEKVICVPAMKQTPIVYPCTPDTEFPPNCTGTPLPPEPVTVCES